MSQNQQSRSVSNLGALLRNALQSPEGLAAASVVSGADPTLPTVFEAAKREDRTTGQADGKPATRSA